MVNDKDLIINLFKFIITVNIDIKKVKQEYLTKEFEFDIADDDINSRKSDHSK